MTTPSFEALGWAQTPEGPISLWRRRELRLDVDVYEVKLGDEYLMSSLFTVAEEELARIGLAEARGESLDVVVGGLGLGYTAIAVLEDPRVRSLEVIEALAEVVGWHEDELLPEAPGLATDDRVTLRHDDFFACSLSDEGLRATTDDGLVDAILVDIDHTPSHHLAASHADFYSPDGLRKMCRTLRPGGVFALWSDQAPTDDFLATMGEVFDRVEGHVVTFPNPLTSATSENGIYVGVGSAP